MNLGFSFYLCLLFCCIFLFAWYTHCYSCSCWFCPLFGGYNIHWSFWKGGFVFSGNYFMKKFYFSFFAVVKCSICCLTVIFLCFFLYLYFLLFFACFFLVILMFLLEYDIVVVFYMLQLFWYCHNPTVLTFDFKLLMNWIRFSKFSCCLIWQCL